MFVKAVPDNKGGKDGYFCSLVESRRVKGKPSHKKILSFGYIPKDRLPYLRAAFKRSSSLAPMEAAVIEQSVKYRVFFVCMADRNLRLGLHAVVSLVMKRSSKTLR